MSAFDHWQKDGNNDLRYFAGYVIFGNNTTPSDKFNVVNGGIDVLYNSGSANAHLDIIETGSTDGARISFKNLNQTNNRWTLFGRASNTSSSNLFHIFHNLGGNVLTLEGDTGDLGLGGSPTSDLHIYQGNNGGADGIRLQNTNNNTWIRMYVSSSSGDLRFYSTAEGTDPIAAINDMTGAYSVLSDRRKKQEIENLKFDWNTFMKVNPVRYSFKKDSEKKSQVGLIAQDVQKLYPEIVNYYQEEDLYHIKYAELNVIAIKAIQDQQKTITAQNQVLQDQAIIIKSQEDRISKLEKLMEKLVEK